MRQFMSLYIGTLLFFPSLLYAGQIYGSVSRGNRAVGGAAIEIDCGGVKTPGATGPDGSYRIQVSQQGQCILKLVGYAGPASAKVYSYPNPSRYDFELVWQPNGTYELRKR